MDKTAQDQLEDFIDKHGLQASLEAFSIICAEKDLHITETWYDFGLASQWGKVGKAVYRVACLKAVQVCDGRA